MGRSLLQLSENWLFLTLSLGPFWNYPDMTELLLSHLKFSMCVTSKDAQISLSLCCLHKHVLKVTQNNSSNDFLRKQNIGLYVVKI